MKKLQKIFLLIAVLFSLWGIDNCQLSTAHAAVPHLINYQGRLTDSSGTPLNGSYNITFRIYDAATAGNMLWQEAQTGVVIQKGIFSVLLGSATALNLAFDQQYFLAVQVGSDPEMSPRQQITSAGYAVRAETAETLSTPGKVGTKIVDETNIADGRVPIYRTASGKLEYGSSSLRQFFTTSGTWTAPAGVTTVLITAVGGGGGGGGADGGGSTTCSPGGGGAGQAVIKYPYTVVPGNSYTVTINSGGTGGAAGNNTGLDGGSVVFGTLTLVGGKGGGKGSVHTGGLSGCSTNDGVLNVVGSLGIKTGNGGNGHPSGDYYSGAGGCSLWGAGGAGLTTPNADGLNGSGYGAGGGGGLSGAS